MQSRVECMLRIGLTGGIGAGKSTIAEQFRERGVPVIDADEIAREIVEPGEPALASLVSEFGEQILHPDGTLNRGGLAVVAFSDPQSTARLNAIMHPAIAERTRAHYDRHADASIVVHDVPLLVENSMTRLYHLAVLVDTPADVRLTRLVDSRGMDPADAQKRIGAQASDAERLAACDVVIDNSGTPEAARAAFTTMFEKRIQPFADNLAAGRTAERSGVELVPAGERHGQTARRLSSRISHALTEAGLPDAEVEHIGSTSVPGLLAKDIIDLQVLTRSDADWDAAAQALTAAGYPQHHMEAFDDWDDAGHVPKRFHRNADPGQPVNVHVRTRGSLSARFAAHFAQRLRTDAALRADYEGTKKRLAEQHLDDRSTSRCAETKEPFFTPLRDEFRRSESS